MRNMLSKLKLIQNTLLTVSDSVSHYEAFKKPDKYIVWAEDSESNSVEADNRKDEQTIQGTIDYFTKEDMDPKIDEIHAALTGACISFSLNSVQYEDETGYIHYEWLWEV